MGLRDTERCFVTVTVVLHPSTGIAGVLRKCLRKRGKVSRSEWLGDGHTGQYAQPDGDVPFSIFL